MVETTGSLDLSALLAERGFTLHALGGAYLFFLATLAAAAAVFAAARHLTVVSPNRGARDYGCYVTAALAVFSIATALENEMLPAGMARLHYALVPQVVVLLAIHVAIARRQEPWLVTLGAAACAGTVVIGFTTGLATGRLDLEYALSLVVLAALLARLWQTSVSTQRGFASARSIYVGSKETPGGKPAPQQPKPLFWIAWALLGVSFGLLLHIIWS